jgi:spermidine synthase
VIPWETLGRARADGGGELVLVRRGDEHVIRVDGKDLMSSRVYGSEQALASLALKDLPVTAPRILVGGLGLGYTLRAALDLLPPGAAVTVVELLTAVVEWNRGPLGPLCAHPLDDPRVTVQVGDVGAFLRKAHVRFDAILLDVDNGPVALTRKANQALYGDTGLATAKRALRPGGILAVWSAAPVPDFERRLSRQGFSVAAHTVPARGAAGGPKHTIFVAACASPGLAPK